MLPAVHVPTDDASLVPYVAFFVLAAIPLLFVSLTSFLKISVVFSILRNALGTGQIPSGTVVTALSIILSLYVMAPVGSEMIDAATPSAAGIDVAAPLAHPNELVAALRAGAEPLRSFLVRNAGTRERAMFLDLAREARPEDQREGLADTDFLVAAPAFVVTELGEAFQIGFLIFLPFLIVDLVIANVLTALGLSSLSPTQVSLPFKLLLFVMVDGWYLLARALVLGYA
jgi:type III secretion protein R